MIYETPCPECEGSGGIIKARTNRGELILHPLNHCPHCKGSGGFNLVVEEQKCSDCGKINKIPWCDCGGYHRRVDRPLTVDEVEELTVDVDITEILHWLELQAPVYYKGASVKLMPREG